MSNDPGQLVELQQRMNAELSGIGQMQNAISRAKREGELLNYLQNVVRDLAERRRRTIAEALVMPGATMAQVTSQLNLSRSAVVKLATPDLRVQMAKELTLQIARVQEQALAFRKQVELMAQQIAAAPSIGLAEAQEQARAVHKQVQQAAEKLIAGAPSIELAEDARRLLRNLVS